MTRAEVHRRVRGYYEGTLAAHGVAPKGVDWNSAESQELRFVQLERLWAQEPAASLLDYGCGYGALASFVRRRGHEGAYTGFDLSGAMIDAARAHAAPLAACTFTAVRADLPPSDYAVASGVFNVRTDVDAEAWSAYVRETLADLAALGSRGFAFNALSLDSDVHRRRSDLHYADAMDLLDHCRRTYSRRAALLHDYPLYEFTILVRR